MTTLQNSATIKVDVPVGQRLTVVAATGGVGLILREADQGNGVSHQRTTIATGETKRFGPFRCPVRYEISCSGATLDVSTAVVLDEGAEPGVSDASNATVGDVGEVLTATLAVGDAVALVTTEAKDVLTLDLTPGDWDVDAVLGLIPAATTSITNVAGGLHTTADTLGAAGTYFQRASAAVVPGAVQQHNPVPTQRFNVAVATTIHLVAKATFTVDTLAGFGTIRARRVR